MRGETPRVSYLSSVYAMLGEKRTAARIDKREYEFKAALQLSDARGSCLKLSLAAFCRQEEIGYAL